MTSHVSDLIKLILSESSKIKIVAKLKQKGRIIVFAPDTSEIHNYISPYRDITEATYERDVRYWFAIKSLLEHDDNINILIPPYFYETRLMLDAIRRQVKDMDELKSSIELLISTNKFKNLIKDFNKWTNNPDGSTELWKTYGKELSLLYELMTTQKEINRWIELKLRKNFHADLTFIKNIDNNKVSSDSVKWQRDIELRRRGEQTSKAARTVNKDEISLKSKFDGWAIEYLIQANLMARKIPEGNPFVVFISRSTIIHDIIKNNLDIRIKDIGLLQAAWTPDTYLVYHLIAQVPGVSYEEIIQYLDEIYVFVKKHQENTEKPLDKSIFEKLIKSNKIVQAIENISTLYEKVRAENFTELIDLEKIKKFDHPEQAKVLINILGTINKRNIAKITKQMEEGIDRLWLEFRENFPVLSLSDINSIPHLAVKCPGHRIWIHFINDNITSWLGGNSIYEIIFHIKEKIDKLRSEGALDEEITLIYIVIDLVNQNFASLEKRIYELENSENPMMRREAILFKLSVQFIKEDTFVLSNNDIEKLLGDFNNDPRLPKVLSLQAWNQWNKTKESKYLTAAYTYAKQALDMVEIQSEFKAECLNNFAYFLFIYYENNLIPLGELGSTLNKLVSLCQEVYGQKKYPVEFIHTISVIKADIAWNDTQLSLSERINILQDEEQKLLEVFRSNRTNKLYEQDWKDANGKLEKLLKEFDKNSS